jgi:hypothetical protein
MDSKKPGASSVVTIDLDADEFDESFANAFSNSIRLTSRLRSRSMRSLFSDEPSEFGSSREVQMLLQQQRNELHNNEIASERSYFENSRDKLSTFSETLFNATNSLVGIGLLSLPYALHLCGWLGLGILFCFAALTCYTAKLLGRIMDHTPRQDHFHLHTDTNITHTATGTVCACMCASSHVRATRARSRKLREGPEAYTMTGFHDMGFAAFGEVPARLRPRPA